MNPNEEVIQAVADAIEQRRTNKEFIRRLERHIEENRKVLDRLKEIEERDE